MIMNKQSIKLVALSGLLASAPCYSATTSIISQAYDGTRTTADSRFPQISADGQYVTFVSSSDNLVMNDTNGKDDVFVYHYATGTMERISVSDSGVQANGDSFFPSISANGRYIAFGSTASNLSPDDLNTRRDIFRHDRVTGETLLITRSTSGGATNGGSGLPKISGDGQVIAFESVATNLVPGDTNGLRDIFAYDGATDSISRVSLTADGSQILDGGREATKPTISDNGRYVTYQTWADDVVPNDDRHTTDIFRYDRQTGETRIVSLSSAGEYGNNQSEESSVSGDGRYVLFNSSSDNLVPGDDNDETDIFVHDTMTEQTLMASVKNDGNPNNGFEFSGDISDDGQFVVFSSTATNIAPNDNNHNPDIFLRDLLQNTTTRISVSDSGVQSDRASLFPSISSDGTRVVFQSQASNLIDGNPQPGLLKNIYLIELDPASSVVPAKLKVAASIDGQSTLTKPGPALPNSGSTATWDFVVSNTGDEEATGVKLFIKRFEPQLDNTWSLLCELGDITGAGDASCSDTSLIVDGAFKMLISAQGYDKNGDKTIGDTPAWYVGGSNSTVPSLDLTVLLNGQDNDNDAPGQAFNTGGPVSYTYSVTNTGPFELTYVRVYSRFYADAEYSPPNSKWKRACIFARMQPGQTLTCTEQVTVPAGEIRRDISAQTFYHSDKITRDEQSYFIGQ